MRLLANVVVSPSTLSYGDDDLSAVAQSLEICSQGDAGVLLLASDVQGVGINDWWFDSVEEAKAAALDWFQVSLSAWTMAPDS